MSLDLINSHYVSSQCQVEQVTVSNSATLVHRQCKSIHLKDHSFERGLFCLLEPFAQRQFHN